jgi:hypothetical protein
MVLATLQIVYPPHLLIKGYQQELLHLYRKNYNTKSIKYGYIINIEEVKEIITTILDKNNNIIINSLCDCNIFKPEISLQLECMIDMIHINGIFVSKYNIKILILSNDSYTYNNNTFTYKDQVYNKGDNILVEITNVRFEKNIYTCIGTLV